MGIANRARGAFVGSDSHASDEILIFRFGSFQPIGPGRIAGSFSCCLRITFGHRFYEERLGERRLVDWNV
jgi:hypothetical protein